MKAVLMMYKVFLRYPEALRPAFPKLKEKLEDPDPGKFIINPFCRYHLFISKFGCSWSGFNINKGITFQLRNQYQGSYLKVRLLQRKKNDYYFSRKIIAFSMSVFFVVRNNLGKNGK